MNEQILELARQVWPDPNISHVNHEKFAELIVRECAQVARNHILQKYPGMEEYDGVVFVEQAIRKHFGVVE
jgi:hypothetical protein